MKKLGTTIVCIMLMFSVKAQTTSLNTLIKYVNTPLADITEEVISKNGWELKESKKNDSLVLLIFRDTDNSLIIKRYKDLPNEVYFICDKPEYDLLNKALLARKLTLFKSEVDTKGHIVKSYFEEKYIFEVTIAPNSLFSITVLDRTH
ncbi:hypothetical protein [Pedobacter gandavensis]|uniref:hypothetical protein n=1 Tax=Pedobacter gandavensis TaxID=2679963 RepID=UPI00292EDF65|nr:hypothetical protein [Pedobacter gandavensis]